MTNDTPINSTPENIIPKPEANQPQDEIITALITNPSSVFDFFGARILEEAEKIADKKYGSLRERALKEDLLSVEGAKDLLNDEELKEKASTIIERAVKNEISADDAKEMLGLMAFKGNSEKALQAARTEEQKQKDRFKEAEAKLKKYYESGNVEDGPSLEVLNEAMKVGYRFKNEASPEFEKYVRECFYPKN